ncbi:MAG: rod shape-determining protein [Firmicutes bacterium]|nr:rod shape-determining protein [Bacillota bacterium]
MFFNLFGFGDSIGIDLGTATVLVYVKGKGIVLREPSVVAIDKSTNSVLAVGEEARKMIGKTPGSIVAVRPLKEGVISDYDTTERMLKYFIEKAGGRHAFAKPTIAVCVPSAVTSVERRAVEDATRQAGARKVLIIEEPIAAAIGAGIDIAKACGSMVVDIGGGTTDVAVISLGGNVVSTSIKVAGDNFDEAIIKYMRRKHNVLIGERTAEELKINVGTAFPRTMSVNMDVRGRDLVTGLPKLINVTSEEMYDALVEPVEAIVNAVHGVLEKTPPELAADIADRGIVMTGGGSLLYGLDKIIADRTKINTIIADDAVSCVARGTGNFIEYIEGGAERKKVSKKREKHAEQAHRRREKSGRRERR